ncbi:hypothetical protein QFC20_006978 [Naganishia adeliensis]|uniref:Uncharacterized protein n=1 Tax=Naganishia adeliensis TaxID=92952 RepID=A0ACC2V461_9TREE|nr:hypothetical protein QFC20_006978 [Naganishia adeliensis]
MFRLALRTATTVTQPAVRAFSTTPTLLKISAGELNARAKQLGLELPPKAPMGAYAEFFRELYPKIRENYVKENGKIDSHEVARFTGAKWNALSESDKKPYEELSKRATEKYKSDYKRYYESLSEDQVHSLGLDSPALKGLKKSARNAVNRKARGQPAKPSGSFFVFMHDFRKSDELKEMMERDGVEKAQRSIYAAKKAGEKWGVMSDEEKKQWVDKNEEARATYAEWKAQNA